MYLHVVAFDIPYPANYGGVIVIYNQIKALHARGAQIILHCYQYKDRTPQPELEKYCHEVHYYKRSRSFWYQLSLLPFIMRTRQNSLLLKRLKKAPYPILFHGMHTAGLIWDKKIRSQQKLVQMHNIEWQYYENLFKLASPLNVFEKIYYFIESIKLQRIEPKVVLHADNILTLSTNDEAYYRAMKPNTTFIPAFHPNQTVESRIGRGEYVLFHGKLSVPDNDFAAQWIIDEVFSKLNIPFVIAGMEPSSQLKEKIKPFEHISLVENPDEKKMNDLLQKAQINLLVSNQVAGVKLKLINALFRGRFCIVNDKMVSGSGLEAYCYVRNSAASIRQTIEALINAPFEEQRIEERKALLENEYSNEKNAGKLMEVIQFDAIVAKKKRKK
jgi:hypothetical protein